MFPFQLPAPARGQIGGGGPAHLPRVGQSERGAGLGARAFPSSGRPGEGGGTSRRAGANQRSGRGEEKLMLAPPLLPAAAGEGPQQAARAKRPFP